MCVRCIVNLLKTILIFTKACESLQNISLKVLNERVLKYLPTDCPIARPTLSNKLSSKSE